VSSSDWKISKGHNDTENGEVLAYIYFVKKRKKMAFFVGNG